MSLKPRSFFQLGGQTDQEYNFNFGNQNPQNNILDRGYVQAQTNLVNAQANQIDQGIANSQFGFNMNTFSNVMDGINSIGNLWGAWQAQKLAKDQWKTQKSVLNTNMMNQIQAYNNSLKDRLDTRAHVEGRDQASADRQYEERKAARH